MDPNSTLFADNERVFIGLTYSSLSSVGFLAHGWSFYELYYNIELKSLFVTLCLLNAIVSMGLTLVFAAWYGSFVIFELQGPIIELVDRKIEMLACFLYYIVVYSHLGKSCDRLLAISKPIFYRTFFTNKKKKIVVGIVSLSGFLHVVPQFSGNCYVEFDYTYLSTNWTATDCGYIIGFYVELIFFSSIIAVSFLFDLITLYFVRQRLVHELNNDNFVKSKEKQRLKLDFGLFIQTFVTGFIQLIMLLNFDFVVRFMENKWTILLTTTISWICFHVLDGLSIGFEAVMFSLQIILNMLTLSRLVLLLWRTEVAQDRQRLMNSLRVAFAILLQTLVFMAPVAVDTNTFYLNLLTSVDPLTSTFSHLWIRFVSLFTFTWHISSRTSTILDNFVSLSIVLLSYSCCLRIGLR